jgi:hypothetical protein
MMHRQLAEVAEAGREPIAVLWASETTIYPRYGYGPSAGVMSLSAMTRELRSGPTARAPACGLRWSTRKGARRAWRDLRSGGASPGRAGRAVPARGGTSSLADLEGQPRRRDHRGTA